ncbi:4Fe-4S ferredoxin [Streptomyces griseochromogenes]|uniref:Ferredoxin n=1 Tax=Streptomyces griseochromogenes TaxID=68214 RepID=A0A1B1BE25_9ACTN|nr:4Fe-4S ferredoxin [Streptomyces griseochromogenes]
MTSPHFAAPPEGEAAQDAPAATVEQRIAERRRNSEWRKEPRRIEQAECIGCDSCMRACPPQFSAVYNRGLDVVIVPELCNGCAKCVQACPVDCIYPDPAWQPTDESLWAYVEGQENFRAPK